MDKCIIGILLLFIFILICCFFGEIMNFMNFWVVVFFWLFFIINIVVFLVSVVCFLGFCGGGIILKVFLLGFLLNRVIWYGLVMNILFWLEWKEGMVFVVVVLIVFGCIVLLYIMLCMKFRVLIVVGFFSEFLNLFLLVGWMKFFLVCYR